MVQSRSNESFRRARDLTTQLLESELNDAESHELAGLLRHNQELQEWYVDHVILHGMLELAHLDPLKAHEPTGVHPFEEDFSETESPAPKGHANPSSTSDGSATIGLLGDLFQRGVTFLGRPSVFGLVIAIGLPGIILLVLLVDLMHQPVEQMPVASTQAFQASRKEMVAEVTQQRACVWGDKSALSVGSQLDPGQKLHLDKGLIELTFADGAKVILEGPCTFQADSGKRGFLHAGSLVAKVGKEAVGFTIQTPSATVVDLGTEFGLSVGKGVSEVQVFKGQVEVGPSTPVQEGPKKFHKLNVGQAVRVRAVGAGQTEVEKIPAASKCFARRLPPRSADGLPEPTILFAHRGSCDPKTEGWAIVRNESRAGETKSSTVAPTNDQNIPAWLIDDGLAKYSVKYQIKNREGLTPKLLAEADAKGWVMRFLAKSAGEPNAPSGSCFYGLWGRERDWSLRLTVDQNGNQVLLLHGQSSLGLNGTVAIPNSRNQYVDYEVRYHPETKDADVYVNGQLVATGYFRERGVVTSNTSLHFGTFLEVKGCVSFARVEWGVLDP